MLYVVDSVTRKWTEQAKTAGQPITSSAQDGTFAAGVHRVKELLPVLMNDIITTAPEDQKVRRTRAHTTTQPKCRSRSCCRDHIRFVLFFLLGVHLPLCLTVGQN